jgi:hypothetical protein
VHKFLRSPVLGVQILLQSWFGRTEQLPDSACRSGISGSYSDNAIYVTKVQLGLRERSWLLALSTPSGFGPIIESYGKNT